MRPSSCAVELDKSYKRLAPIANYTNPHPALFPNQGAHESQRLLCGTWKRSEAEYEQGLWIKMLLFHHSHMYRMEMVWYGSLLRIKMSE